MCFIWATLKAITIFTSHLGTIQNKTWKLTILTKQTFTHQEKCSIAGILYTQQRNCLVQPNPSCDDSMCILLLDQVLWLSRCCKVHLHLGTHFAQSTVLKVTASFCNSLQNHPYNAISFHSENLKNGLHCALNCIPVKYFTLSITQKYIILWNTIRFQFWNSWLSASAMNNYSIQEKEKKTKHKVMLRVLRKVLLRTMSEFPYGSVTVAVAFRDISKSRSCKQS